MSDEPQRLTAGRAMALIGHPPKWVRVYDAHSGRSLMDEGELIGYCDQQTISLRRRDSTTSSWSIDCPVQVITCTDCPVHRAGVAE